MTTRDLVKNYIILIANGSEIGLEDYVRKVLVGYNKVDLRSYCKEHEIYYRKGSNREMMLQKIYGMCKTALSYKILQTNDITGESIKDYYKRILEGC